MKSEKNQIYVLFIIYDRPHGPPVGWVRLRLTLTLRIRRDFEHLPKYYPIPSLLVNNCCSSRTFFEGVQPSSQITQIV